MTATGNHEPQGLAGWGRALVAAAILIVGTFVTLIAFGLGLTSNCDFDIHCEKANGLALVAAGVILAAIPLTMTATGVWAVLRSTKAFLIWLATLVVLAFVISPLLLYVHFPIVHAFVPSPT